jgi:hypothetical protein
MKTIKSLIIILGILLLTPSCQKMVEGLNDNPNKVTPDDVLAKDFLTGAMLANIDSELGHLNRIAGMWSGQLVGYQSLYSNIYGYNISTAESISPWHEIYVGMIPNLRHIRQAAPNDKLLVGIAETLEAQAIGTAASLFGDVPYAEIDDPNISDPHFDPQQQVFTNVIALLDAAITDLNAATSRSLAADIYFGGNAAEWLEAAYTLKARFYLDMKDYTNAYQAAQHGISSPAGSMKFTPIGDPAIKTGNKNLFFEVLAGARTGDIGNRGSFLLDLLDPANANSRNNAKTDETARFEYYKIDETSADANQGIASEFEPQKLVSYGENTLILAECAARTVDFNTALGYLNQWRQYLNTGGFVNANFAGQPYKYDDYVAADFDNGGMLNADGIDPTRALMREIIQEKYVSGFLSLVPFDDARRLRKSDADLEVPFPLNPSSVTSYPERFPYSADELNSNSNAPAEDPGIFVKTQVNQ